jgi:RNA polymerase sigma-54 factor
MKPSLQLKLSQHLTLTPQLQQSIRLLQLSTLELNQEVERMLQENPLLERAEGEDEDSGLPAGAVPLSGPVSVERTASTPEGEGANGADEAPFERSEDWSGIGSGSRLDDDDENLEPQTAASVSLRDHLTEQLTLTTLPDRDRHIIAILIDALDEDGYFTTTLEDIQQMLPEELGIEPEELAIALKQLQNFDPAGIGARDVAECLQLQLRALPASTPFRDEALLIAGQHLGMLAAHDFTKLKRALRCDDATLRGARQLITSLNPRPGARYSQTEATYVVPDVIVRKVRGRWLASLNEAAMPKLRLNRIYADILARNREASNQQLASQLQEAKWLIKNVQQRFDTILRVSQAIIDRQRHFFDHGEVAMKPLVLREIADILGLHESTISRVTTQKYMLTPRGTYELKYFFGSHVATDTGGAASATAIRALIKQMIQAEDAKQPLTDSKIAELLGHQGIVVARRTIAKYREAMQIPAVNLRKSL